MTASTEEASITGLREALRVGSFLPRTPDISQKMEMSVPHKADIVQNRQNWIIGIRARTQRRTALLPHTQDAISEEELFKCVFFLYQDFEAKEWVVLDFLQL